MPLRVRILTSSTSSATVSEIRRPYPPPTRDSPLRPRGLWTRVAMLGLRSSVPFDPSRSCGRGHCCRHDRSTHGWLDPAAYKPDVDRVGGKQSERHPDLHHQPVGGMAGREMRPGEED